MKPESRLAARGSRTSGEVSGGPNSFLFPRNGRPLDGAKPRPARGNRQGEIIPRAENAAQKTLAAIGSAVLRKET